MGKLTQLTEYNRDFSTWLLHIPSMTMAEQIFHYIQRLKTRTRIEVERAEPSTRQDAMKLQRDLTVCTQITKDSLE